MTHLVANTHPIARYVFYATLLILIYSVCVYVPSREGHIKTPMHLRQYPCAHIYTLLSV